MHGIGPARQLDLVLLLVLLPVQVLRCRWPQLYLANEVVVVGRAGVPNVLGALVLVQALLLTRVYPPTGFAVVPHRLLHLLLLVSVDIALLRLLDIARLHHD